MAKLFLRNKELIEIRKNLLFARNPNIKANLTELTIRQLEVSKKFSPDITSELEGIAKGSGTSIEEIVILNNYTASEIFPYPMRVAQLFM